jgi:uncharacterized protein (DUF2235 family)
MPKKIVFCADGTWKHPLNPVKVENTDTNVYKLYKSLAYTSTQLTTYDDGVGADGLVAFRILGGAFGLGLFDKIKHGYTALAHAYEKGDSVYIFGFSRGAYTARSLAGMVAVSGLPTRNFDDICVDLAFEAYRQKDNRASLLEELNSKYAMDNAQISMLGVWDTVGALGIPGAIFGHSEDDFIYGFLDTALHPNVRCAYQALAIDERRSEFQPTLWTSAPLPGQTIEQVWFTGVHSDVGGGYNETGLSDITLSWMMGKARQNGLEFIDSIWQQYANIDPKHALDQKHESWSVLWGFPRHRDILARSAISNSVQLRLSNDHSYRPSNLNIDGAGNLTGYSVVPILGTAMGASG